MLNIATNYDEWSEAAAKLDDIDGKKQMQLSYVCVLHNYNQKKL
jgi:hypothetical protein